ncbi:hypothetical protein P4O66_003056 [Electrophorus voltai]|uniref:Uncharacterized protein n=1 Tax=Electrophorus voltai TaxID=2609070 RepID=A0AAD9DLY0_9TELE|nr:hypothetical protein P4O66_003056 [Electrophorus voltai]
MNARKDPKQPIRVSHNAAPTWPSTVKPPRSPGSPKAHTMPSLLSSTSASGSPWVQQNSESNASQASRPIGCPTSSSLRDVQKAQGPIGVGTSAHSPNSFGFCPAGLRPNRPAAGANATSAPQPIPCPNRLWLFLAAAFLLRDTDGLGVWNKKPVPHWSSVAARASMAQPQKVSNLPHQTKVEGSTSSAASMQSSSAFPLQGPEPSRTRTGQPSCVSSSQMDSSEAQTTSGSAGYYQSVFQGGQQFPGVVSQPQLLDSSGNVEARYWGQSSESVLSTPQISSSLFERDALHGGSSGSLDSVSSAQGFPSQYTSSWLYTAQSAPTHQHQGGYWAPSSGQSMHLPSEEPQPHVASPPQPESYQQLPHPSQTRPVSKPVSQTQTVGGALVSTSQQGSNEGQYQSSSWSASAPVMKSRLPFIPSQSTIVSSDMTSPSQQSASDSAQKGCTSSYGALPPWLAGTRQTSTLQSAQSQMQGSSVGLGVASTSQQSASDAPLKTDGPLSGTGQTQMQIMSSSSTSIKQQSASDAAQKGCTSSNGALPPWLASTWQTSSAQSQMQPSSGGSGVSSTSQQSSGEAPLKPDRPLSGTGQTQMQSPSAGLTSTSQQSSGDVPQTSSAYYGSLDPQGAGTWQPSAQTAQSQMQGSSVGLGVACTSQQSASDAPLKPDGPLSGTGQTQMQSPSAGLTSTSQQSSGDVPQTSSAYYGSLDPQGAGTWQPSAQTAQSQMQGSSVGLGVACTSQQSAIDAPLKPDGPLSAQGAGTGQTQMQSPSSGLTSKSYSFTLDFPVHSF